YPDCRQVFYEAYQNVVELGTRPETTIAIITPVIQMSKGDIVEAGIRLAAPLHLTWSCYKSEAVACGRCDSCALRLRGFQQAGATDPIPYQE
ncbi:MAG: 7-cyano-7-deazaguanine synthase, partial [Chlorobi bacterium CHB2]|nr:7-cyano-7-deazaguanine synthase [Chlorobi bacterium CHB2]